MPLAEAAYQELRRRILCCELLPASAITEGAIVEHLAIGKTPVREAMRRLVQEGLLTVTPRAGYTVATITDLDVDDVFQLRSIAEASAAELAAGRLDANVLARLEALCAIGYDPRVPESIVAYLRLNAEFHRLIAESSGNRRLCDLVAQLLDESQRMIHLGMLRQPSSHGAQREHTELLAALRDGKAEEARAVVTRHIGHARDIVRASLAPSRSERPLVPDGVR